MLEVAVIGLLRLVGFDLRRKPRRLGKCTACGTTVFDDDPHMRARGEVWHVDPCSVYSGRPPPRR